MATRKKPEGIEELVKWQGHTLLVVQHVDDGVLCVDKEGVSLAHPRNVFFVSTAEIEG